ncbi:tyrosine-type recombinase/integrase [Novosphingobium sp.]|uniref:tyrosine-type recombinase/integrase n=1 Tax=Novosphingobium sp. TaxID=1874826 RepID=UPI003B518EB7
MSKPIKTPKSPYWQYDFQFKGVRFHGSTGCTSQRDAQRFIDKKRREVTLGETPVVDSPTIDRACGLWWEAVGELKANKATDEYRLAALIAGLGGSRLLSSLTLRDLDAYVAQRMAPRAIPAKTHMAKGKLIVDKPAYEARLSRSSVNREIQLLRRVVLWLGQPGRGYTVPRLEWKAALGKEAAERIRELSGDEEARLFAVLDADLAAFAEFAMLSGQRRTELVNLKWSEVDLQGARARTILKGGDPHSFPLSPRMLAILKGLPRVKGIDQVFTYECRDDRPSMHGDIARIKGKRYPLSKQGWTRRWRKALAEAGIEGFRFHDLRHTAATRIVRATGSLKVAQRLLGHSNIATTARYAHASEDDLREAMEKAQSGVSYRNSPGPKLRSVK